MKSSPFVLTPQQFSEHSGSLGDMPRQYERCLIQQTGASIGDLLSKGRIS